MNEKFVMRGQDSNTRKTIEKQYSLQSVADRYMALYNDLLSQDSG